MLILAIIFSVFFLVVLTICGFSGFKKGFTKSITGLISNLLSIVISIALAKRVGIQAKSAVVSILDNYVKKSSNPNEYIKVLVTSSDSTTKILQFFAASIAALSIFYIFYFIFYLLMKIPAHLIHKYAVEPNITEISFYKTRKFAPFICILSGIISLSVLLSPIATNAYIFKKSAKEHNVKVSGDISPIYNNPACFISNYFGGKLAYESLTTIKIKGNKYSLSKETKNIFDLIFKANAFDNDELTAEEFILLLNSICEVYDNSELLQELVAATISYASEEFMNNLEVFEFDFSDNSGLSKDITDSFFELVNNLDTDEIIEASLPIINLLVTFVEKGIDEDILDDEKALLNIFSDKDFVLDTYTTLYSSKELAPLITEFELANVQSACEIINVDADIIKVKEDAANLTEAQIREEAELVANIVSSVEKYDKSGDDKELESIMNMINSSYILEMK